MGITSFYYLVFLGIVILLYFILPIKVRWLVILAADFFFVYTNNSRRAICVMLLMIFTAYFSGILIEKLCDKNRIRKIVLLISIVIEAGALLLLKETVFLNHFTNLFGANMPIEAFRIYAPLGMSYFTLTMISYVLETYWMTQPAQKNIFKFFTYAAFFPALTSGPIMNYVESGDNILTGHRFDYKNLCFGSQRILWGFFKKIVVAERLAVVVDFIYADPVNYNGIYIWVAASLFALQLYCDFSGCIDVIMGTSEIMGIELPENFDVPFSAKNTAEFWRRWHITLGAWLKAYIFYPILKSNLVQQVGAHAKKLFGKKYGKKIPSWIGLICTWALIGLWHGGTVNYIWGVGVWFGIVIILSEALEPLLKKINKVLCIKTECFSWKLFQSVRTFIIFIVGIAAFRAGSWTNTRIIYRSAISDFNPWVLWDKSFLNMGLTQEDYNVLWISLLVIFIAGILKLKLQDTSVREWVSKQNLLFRWLVWVSLFVFVLIWGMYGPGYDAAEFIYKGF